MSSSGFSATSGSRLFWIIRNAASCGHARQCSSVPRGARTTRVAMLTTSIVLLVDLAAHRALAASALFRWADVPECEVDGKVVHDLHRAGGEEWRAERRRAERQTRERG